MKATKSKVFKMAWKMFKSDLVDTFSEALRKAWAQVKAIKAAIKAGHDRFTIHHNISLYIGGTSKERINIVYNYFTV